MVLLYYYDLMSQPCRAVYMFLKMNNIPFEPRPVVLGSGEHRTEEFKKINPFSLVPVLDDNGFILTESAAIIKYLAVKYSVPEHWYPRIDLQAQARVDEFLHWQHRNIRFNGVATFQHLVVIPRTKKAPINWQMVENARNRLDVAMNDLQKYFLKNNKKFLCGSDISVADLICVCELMQLYACWEEKSYQSNPVVNAWVDRVMERTKPYFEESHEIINSFRNLHTKQAQENLKRNSKL